jgi:hypothetical protein
MRDARLTYALGLLVLFALLALAACTPTAEWPEGRGTEPPAQEWHGQPEPNPPSIDREDTE